MEYLLYSLNLVLSCVIFGIDIVGVICLGTENFYFIRGIVPLFEICNVCKFTF